MCSPVIYSRGDRSETIEKKVKKSWENLRPFLTKLKFKRNGPRFWKLFFLMGCVWNYKLHFKLLVQHSSFSYQWNHMAQYKPNCTNRCEYVVKDWHKYSNQTRKIQLLYFYPNIENSYKLIKVLLLSIHKAISGYQE